MQDVVFIGIIHRLKTVYLERVWACAFCAIVELFKLHNNKGVRVGRIHFEPSNLHIIVQAADAPKLFQASFKFRCLRSIGSARMLQNPLVIRTRNLVKHVHNVLGRGRYSVLRKGATLFEGFVRLPAYELLQQVIQAVAGHKFAVQPGQVGRSLIPNVPCALVDDFDNPCQCLFACQISVCLCLAAKPLKIILSDLAEKIIIAVGAVVNQNAVGKIFMLPLNL